MLEQYLSWSGISGNPNDPMVKGGQAAFLTPGTVTWTVPAGVTMISAVLVSAGQQGTCQIYEGVAAGRGGCVRWQNNIPVTPGDVYTLEIGSGGTARFVALGTAAVGQTNYFTRAFDLVAGITAAESTTVAGAVGGGNGGPGLSGSGSTFQGGDSATFISNVTTNTGKGITLTNVRVNSNYPTGAICGGGGGATAVTSGNRTLGKGGDGGIRIMWGIGRAYPSTNIADRV